MISPVRYFPLRKVQPNHMNQAGSKRSELQRGCHVVGVGLYQASSQPWQFPALLFHGAYLTADSIPTSHTLLFTFCPCKEATGCSKSSGSSCELKHSICDTPIAIHPRRDARTSFLYETASDTEGSLQILTFFFAKPSTASSHLCCSPTTACSRQLFSRADEALLRQS